MISFLFSVFWLTWRTLLYWPLTCSDSLDAVLCYLTCLICSKIGRIKILNYRSYSALSKCRLRSRLLTRYDSFLRCFLFFGGRSIRRPRFGLSFRLSSIVKSHQRYNSWRSTKIASYSIGIPKGIFLLLKVARTIFPLFWKGQSKKKKILSHGSTFVELDYTMNAWLKTIIISHWQTN